MNNEVEFNGLPVLYALMISLLAMSIAYSLEPYLGWGFGLSLGLGLAVTFCSLLKHAATPGSWKWRVTFGIAALFIFGTSMSLSYGTLYAKFFAEQSALDDFNRQRPQTMRQLESLLANANTALQALTTWADYSKEQAIKELRTGGSCPAKFASNGVRGAISIFRDTESTVATDLSTQMSQNVARIESQLDSARKFASPSTYSDVILQAREISTLVESSQSLAHGSYVESAITSLSRQSNAMITWPNGETFKCGDNARDDQIFRAAAAMEALRGSPAIKPLQPAIDVGSRHEIMIRGLLRGFNTIAIAFSGGAIGQFSDDTLMVSAIKTGGLINRETLGMVLAGILEATIATLTFLMARRSGSPLLSIDPLVVIRKIRRDIRGNIGGARIIARIGLWLMMLSVAILWRKSGSENTDGPQTQAGQKPAKVFDDNTLKYGALLDPYIRSIHDSQYAYLPYTESAERAHIAARALAYIGHLKLLSTNVSSEILQRYVTVPATPAHQPEASLWAVYLFEAAFAQRLRLRLLGEDENSGANLRSAERSPAQPMGSSEAALAMRSETLHGYDLSERP